MGFFKVIFIKRYCSTDFLFESFSMYLTFFSYSMLSICPRPQKDDVLQKITLLNNHEN